jgi:hypothetical protein
VIVSFLNPELGKWDQIAGVENALVLPFFADERPLRGAAGLCDFRLCGRLSRLLAKNKIGGQWGESTLYPPVVGGVRKLPFSGLLLFGLGPAERFDEASARDASKKVLDIAHRMKWQKFALAPPGRSTGRLSARRALELVLDEAKKTPVDELVVVEAPAGQKEAADLARR